MSLAKEFMLLFRGLERAHGTYVVPTDHAPEGKQEGRAKTLLSPVTEALWKGHLDGKLRIGIIPINDDNCCYFGAFDVDVYPMNLEEVAAKIRTLGLPLTACRSKSGGLHAYLFCSEPVPADLMQGRLKEFSALLGYGGCEVFPKQTRVLKDKGDIGNWINMPYYGGDSTVCYGLTESGRLSAEDFLAHAHTKRLTLSQLRAWTIPSSDDFKGGPPCLQTLAREGFGEGIRNDGLFNVAVYLAKANEATWETDIEEYNSRYCKPPLERSEIQAIVSSVRRKGYLYTCKRPPIVNHCNAGTCRTRAYGIGALTGATVLVGLTKYDTRPPIWFADVSGGGRLELDTEDLQNQVRFQRRCMESLNQMPPVMKANVWNELVSELLNKVVVIEAPVESTPEGRLLELVERFCTGRVQAKIRDEMLLGKPWLNDGRHYFRLSDLMSFLETKKFRDFLPSKVSSILQKHKAQHHFFNLKGKGTNCWSIPAFDTPSGPHKIPELGGEVPF